MLEAPRIADGAIEAALREHYGISIAALTFLPLGNDSASAAYRVEATDGAIYFLKTRSKSGFSPASLAVPRYLRDLGVPHIFAPLLTNAHSPWVMVHDFALAMYPFIEGRIGGDAGMSEQCWIELGRILKKIHTSKLPPDLMQIVPRETFVPSRRSVIPDLEKAVGAVRLADSIHRELAAFWNFRRDEIHALVDRADALGKKLREASDRPIVLCHADMHTRNILLEGNEQFWIVDWDETVLALKERDLMFVVGGIARFLLEPHHTEWFLRGYGDPAIDHDALVYYRNAWAVQDVIAYGEQVFFMPDFSEESRRHALARFKSLFEPGSIVPIALGTGGSV
jgi:spectinomycin phosphotransferase